MNEDIYLGCDIGTGSVKVVARTLPGAIVNEAQVFYEVSHPEAGYAEQDPETIRLAFIDCLKQIVKKLPRSPVAIGLSSCMHSLILLDKDGHVLYPMITWEDTRSYKIARRLSASSTGKYLYRQTGTPVHSMSVLCKIAWLTQKKRALIRQTAKFVGIKEYLWHAMFGVYEVDYSIASATGLFNIHNLAWDPKALAFCGIRADQLSDLVPTTFVRKHPVPAFLKHTLLPAGMAYCIGSSDGCMANVGSGIDQSKKAALTIGTSGAVRVTRTKPMADFKSMIFNYVLDENKIVSGGAINNGGNVMKWLFKTFLGTEQPQHADYDDLEEHIAAISPGCDGLLCLPWLTGERAPVWDEQASGIWLGVTRTHTKYHMVKAALEGICFTLKMILISIEKASGPISELHISGGFIQSASWVQTLADIMQKELMIDSIADASSVGAAMWAQHALGVLPSAAASQKPRMIHPDRLLASSYEKQFRIFRTLYNKTSEDMHALRQLSLSFQKR